MAAKFVIFILTSTLFSSTFSSALASPAPARIVGGIAVDVTSTLFKWLWSLNSPAKAVSGVSSRSLIKFEGGYNVETLFEGTKLGIEPYSVLATPTGELLILDSANSNLYKVSTPLSPYSRPRILVGSGEGHTGHVDGKLRETRMYHPRGMTMDDKGNIYVADTVNMAIRKISDAGVTTIAGGKQNGGSHVDGPSEEAILSDDFDVIYVGCSCSLLIVDRGYQAIREMQLDYHDCPSQSINHDHDGDFHFLGIAVLIATGFFGYMSALLVQRICALFSPRSDPMGRELKRNVISMPHQRLPGPVIPPLIPDEDEPVKPIEGFLTSFVRLIFNAVSSTAEILGAIVFWGFKKKQPENTKLHHFHHYDHQQQQYLRRQADPWPSQDSYIIEDEVEQPFTPAARSPTPRNRPNATFMKKDPVISEHFRQRQMQHSPQTQQQPIQHQQLQKQQMEQQEEQIQHQQPKRERLQQRHGAAAPYAAKSSEPTGAETSEIVFGAVQEQDGRREAVVIKAVEHNDPNSHSHHNVRSRFNYMGYAASSYGYS